MKKTQFWAKILGLMPGIEAIFLSGSLAQGKAHQNSDIDFFIITTPGKIWTARFWVFVVLKFTGQLAKPHNHPGKICPNHFITSDNLEIEEKDPYSADLFSHNKPLHDPLDLFSQFVVANEWVSQFGESFPVQVVVESGKKQKFSQLPLTRTSYIEAFFRWMQIKKIRNNENFKSQGAKIVLSDKELRFHPVPKNRHWKKLSPKVGDLKIHNPYS